MKIKKIRQLLLEFCLPPFDKSIGETSSKISMNNIYLTVGLEARSRHCHMRFISLKLVGVSRQTLSLNQIFFIT